MNEDFKTKIIDEKYSEAILLINNLTLTQEVIDSYRLLQQRYSTTSIQEFLKTNKIKYLIDSLVIKFPSLNTSCDIHSHHEWCKSKFRIKHHYIMKFFR